MKYMLVLMAVLTAGSLRAVCTAKERDDLVARSDAHHAMLETLTDQDWRRAGVFVAGLGEFIADREAFKSSIGGVVCLAQIVDDGVGDPRELSA